MFFQTELIKNPVIFIILLILIIFTDGYVHNVDAVQETLSGNLVDIKKFYLENMYLEEFKDKGIKIVKTLQEEQAFTRHLIEYESQGLKISGMLNVPKGKGKFPVVILNHGFYGLREFSVGLGFKEAADIFARNGYVAVGSDYRGNGYSDKGENFFQHIGYLYDVLYLIEAVKELPYVDKERIGMWGYSLGGWLTLKAIIVNRSVKVAAIFGSMSSNDIDNYAAIKSWHPEVLKKVDEVIGPPEENPDVYMRLSPVSHIKDMPNHIIIHHGEKDESIPIRWAEKLRDSLLKEGKVVEYYAYTEQGHVLQGKAWTMSMTRTVFFFDKYLK